MDLISIGEAARKLGVNASALRYYEERGLVRPYTRRGGRRMYGEEEMRRLAFIQIAQGLELSLDAASAVLNEPSEQWRKAMREQIAALEKLIARARGAQDFLRHAVDCPADHPVRECSYMIEILDRLVAGVTFEQLAAEHGYPGSDGPGMTVSAAPVPPEA
ncbi:MAG: MerR family transcriptional regulator [Streptosporangiales bacterium]|nr:MerR family transcriptional regulator [Streptosporangiales bacterium]